MSEKTYEEKEIGTSFDWKAIIERATKENLTEEEWKELRNRSNQWVTCACGNMCAIIRRDHNGRPYDSRLAELGEQFNMDIDDEDPDSALNTLEAIEHRSKQLIHELTKAASK